VSIVTPESIERGLFVRSCVLLHAMQIWPDVITSEFWSFPIQHAVNLHHVRTNSFLYIQSLHMKTPLLSANDVRVFGSPVYILDRSLHTGTLGPGKWKERSFREVYIGHSKHHASNVILVYNPATRLVSPQPQYSVAHVESFDQFNYTCQQGYNIICYSYP
jgi:hypothetical protein